MNLIEGLQQEMNSVREIIKEYDSLPLNAGTLASSFMKASISMAEKAIANNDIVAMAKAYADLKEYEL